jgi:hypothetical protein
MHRHYCFAFDAWLPALAQPFGCVWRPKGYDAARELQMSLMQKFPYS